MSNDLVSIIMASYNCGKYVEESIRSVQAQTYKNWELLFVDDCSVDDTVERVTAMSKEDPRIRVFCNDHNSGAAVSRNLALRNAKGRWIAFLDSDDIWYAPKLEKQIRFMEENGCSFSYTEYKEMDMNSTPTGVMVSGPRHVTKWGMMNFCWVGCLTVMYDAEKVGLIQIADIRKNNDYAMWLKVARKADCYLLAECLASYRRGRDGSISTHGYATLIKWHYKLWREAERMSPIISALMTARNLFFGVLKKQMYVKKKVV